MFDVGLHAVPRITCSHYQAAELMNTPHMELILMELLQEYIFTGISLIKSIRKHVYVPDNVQKI